ncbi:hypothetical protein GQ457_13G005590 [Hibiscus cannabinus]
MSWNRRRRLNGFKETCVEHRAEEDMGEPLPEYVRRRNCYGLETVWTFSSSAPAAKAIQLLLQAHLVFVSNLPPRFHWKGLWETFAHHGEVVDAFIPLKKSKDGKRFGFVRFSSRADAQRAISRLNGLVLYGFRILVSLARYNVRNSFWKKVSPKVHDEAKDDGLKQDKGEPEYEEEEETVADWRLCGPSVPVPLRQRLYNCYYKLIYVWFLHLLLQQWQQQ